MDDRIHRALSLMHEAKSLIEQASTPSAGTPDPLNGCGCDCHEPTPAQEWCTLCLPEHPGVLSHDGPSTELCPTCGHRPKDHWPNCLCSAGCHSSDDVSDDEPFTLDADHIADYRNLMSKSGTVTLTSRELKVLVDTYEASRPSASDELLREARSALNVALFWATGKSGDGEEYPIGDEPGAHNAAEELGGCRIVYRKLRELYPSQGYNAESDPGGKDDWLDEIRSCACGRVQLSKGIDGVLHAGVYHMTIRHRDNRCVRASDGQPVRDASSDGADS